MAKATKTPSDNEGEISVTIVKFGLKGSDATLQKGLDTIKAALVQSGVVVQTEPRQLRSAPVRQLAVGAQDFEPGTAHEVAEPESDAEEALEITPAPAQRKPAGQKKAPNFKIIKDLKFDDVSPNLSEFVAEKKPDGHLDRYLCIAYWFKHHKGVEYLTTEHFFTAYMTYQWTLPVNAAGPIGDLRHNRRQWLAVGEERGTSTITNAGERRVMEMAKAADA